MTTRGAKVTVQCRCGVAFEARVADRNRGWGRFCSKSCKAIRQTQTTPRRTAHYEPSETPQFNAIWGDCETHPFSSEAFDE